MSAGANVIPKSDGTNLVASSLTDGAELAISQDALHLDDGGGDGRLRLVQVGGISYIQSGLDGTVNSSAPLKFTSISAGTEWAQFDASGNFSTFHDTNLGNAPGDQTNAYGLQVYNNTALGDGAGDTTTAYTLTVFDNTVLGDTSADTVSIAGAVGIGIAPSANAVMTFAGTTGDKIHLFPVNTTSAYGFGVDSGRLQIFTQDAATAIGLGYGDSGAFTETMRIIGGKAGIGTATPAGRLSVATTDAGTNLAAGVWDDKFAVFGPNSGSATGAALGLGYSTTSDEAQITAVAPSAAWKPLRMSASEYSLLVAAANGCTLSSGSVWNCTGGLQVNGTSVATTSNIAGTSGRSARFSGTNTVGTGAFTDDGTNATAQGALATLGSFTAGDSIADTHTINGNATFNLPSGGTGFVKLDSTGQERGLKITQSGTEVAAFTASSSTGEVKLGATAAAGTYFPTFWSGGAEKARIETDGDFCIGATSCSSKLSVTGTASISSTATITGLLTATAGVLATNNTTVQRDDGGLHANKPVVTISNTSTAGALHHRALLFFSTADDGGVVRSNSIEAEGANLNLASTSGGLLLRTSGATRMLIAADGTWSTAAGGTLGDNVGDTTAVTGALTVGSTLAVTAATTLTGALIVNSGATFNSTVQINNTLSTQGSNNLGNNASDTTTVTGQSILRAASPTKSQLLIDQSAVAGGVFSACTFAVEGDGGYLDLHYESNWIARDTTVAGIYKNTDNLKFFKVSGTSNGAIIPVGTISSALATPMAEFDLLTGAFTVNGAATFTSAADFDSTLNVDGAVTMNGNVTAGNALTDEIAVNGFMTGQNAGGYNGVGGKRMQWWTEFYGPAPTSNVGLYADGFLESGTSGGGSVTITSPGSLTISPDSTGGARAYLINPVSTDAITMGADATWTAEAYPVFSSLDTGSPAYWFIFGFADSTAGINQTDGCWFQYDDSNTATAPGTGDANSASTDHWECWCANNSTRTGYLINGTTVSDGSFTTVAAPVDVNGDRLKIVYDGTVQADFYVNDTKVCQITTNLPSGGGARRTGPMVSSAITIGPAVTITLYALNYIFETITLERG